LRRATARLGPLIRDEAVGLVAALTASIMSAGNPQIL